MKKNNTNNHSHIIFNVAHSDTFKKSNHSLIAESFREALQRNLGRLYTPETSKRENIEKYKKELDDTLSKKSNFNEPKKIKI